MSTCAPIRTSEDAQLVLQREELEEEVSSSRRRERDRCGGLHDTMHCAKQCQPPACRQPDCVWTRFGEAQVVSNPSLERVTLDEAGLFLLRGLLEQLVRRPRRQQLAFFEVQ